MRSLAGAILVRCRFSPVTAYGFVARTYRHPPLFRATNILRQLTLQLQSKRGIIGRVPVGGQFGLPS